MHAVVVELHGILRLQLATRPAVLTAGSHQLMQQRHTQGILLKVTHVHAVLIAMRKPRWSQVA